jgi:hypothetical protein
LTSQQAQTDAAEQDQPGESLGWFLHHFVWLQNHSSPFLRFSEFFAIFSTIPVF